MKSIKNLPSPKGTPILGHLKQFNVPNKHQVLEQWVSECGELFKIHFVGKKFIVSADSTINKEILKQRPQHFRRFSKIQEILEEMGIYGVFSSEGETWKKHRLIISEALNLKNIKTFFPVIVATTNKLLTQWNSHAANQKIIDVQKEMMRYTVDITTEIAFGYKMNTLEKNEDVIQQHLELIFPMINARITAPLPIWRYVKSKKDKALDRALKGIEGTIQEFITNAKERLRNDASLREHPSNFLEALLMAQKNDMAFSDQEVFGNVFTMLLAGEDTTSNSISWAIYYLAQYPEIVARIKKETQAICNDAPFPQTYEDMKQLKYTEAVVQEVLRIKPVTPNLYFEALTDTQIASLVLKKGDTVMLQNKVAQTKEQNFSQANDFIPERWLKDRCPMQNHKPGVLHTFGAGARFCPGKNLAIHEMVMAISMLCTNFNFELAVAPDEVNEIFSFTMYPDNLFLRLEK